MLCHSAKQILVDRSAFPFICPDEPPKPGKGGWAMFIPKEKISSISYILDINGLVLSLNLHLANLNLILDPPPFFSPSLVNEVS